jgi:hypothetical protein
MPERTPAADQERRPAEAAPVSLAPEPARLDLSPRGLIALQRTAGNAAVGALLQRAPAAAPPKADAIAALRKLLQDGDAHGAIAHMGRMEPADAGKALGMGDLRSLAVKAFDDEEMAHAMYAMKGGTLHQKLNWMVTEGSSWKLVRPLLVDPSVPVGQKTELYKHDYLRDFFADLLGDDGMAQLVDLLGGTLNDRLRWMAYEDTNYAAVADRIRLASDTDYKTVTADTRWRLQQDLSGKEWSRVQAMLDRGVLNAEEVDTSRKEPHWEKKDYTDPTSKWYVETYDVESKYQLERTRTELRVRVRIKFTGITPTAAHLKLWRDGIDAVWKDAFHVKNADGKKLPIVFDPVFNAGNPHHTIKLVPPVEDKLTGHLVKGRADAGKWYAGPNANSVTPEDTTNGLSAAHEFGHLIGLTDEYQLAKADYERIVGPAPAAVEPPGGFTSHTIMGDKTGGAELRHMTEFVNWLNAHLLPGEKPYRAVAGPP